MCGRYNCECAYLIIPQPTDVSPEIPIIRRVRVQGGVCVLVVIPVIRDPLDRVALKANHSVRSSTI